MGVDLLREIPGKVETGGTVVGAELTTHAGVHVREAEGEHDRWRRIRGRRYEPGSPISVPSRRTVFRETWERRMPRESRLRTID